MVSRDTLKEHLSFLAHVTIYEDTFTEGVWRDYASWSALMTGIYLSRNKQADVFISDMC